MNRYNTLICRLTIIVGMLLLGGPFLTASPPVVMKLLLVAWDTNDISYQSIARDLGQIGIPYDTVFLNNIAPDASGNRLAGLTLTDTAHGRGLYQGIIETDSSFNVCTTSCINLLSAADISKLNTYALQYGVRMVCYYGWPDPSWGLQAGDSGASYTATSPLNVTLTAAGAAVFSYLKPTAAIPVAGQGGGIWAYKALPAAAANETTTPLLMAGPYTVGVTHTTADGRETLAFTMDNYPGYLHSETLSYGVVNWVTKGVFLGNRRVYLNPQIDDLLYGNRLYAPDRAECPGAESCPTVFATGNDLVALANWQANLKASNPLFSTFHTTFAYNGVGSTWFPPTDPVFTQMTALNTQFTWVSHTWDHANLDCYTADSSGTCVPATLAQSQAELSQNITLASTLGITLDRTGMVTPFNGGLTNPDFLQAAAQSGLQYIVSALGPPGVQIGQVNPLNSAIYEIPRRNPDLYDDVSSPLTGVPGSWPDKYNAEYGPAGTHASYAQNQTYNQILDIEGQKLLVNNMLSFEPYALAYHIDNSSLYDSTHSLFSDVIDAAITKYTNLFSLPVLTLDMHAIGPILQTRSSYDASGVVGVYTPGAGVTLTTTNAATIPVTGACSESACAAYGGQLQDNVVMAANSTVALSLTAAEGVAPTSVSLNPITVTGGISSMGTVTLNGIAPAGGVSIALSSNNAAATVPAAAVIAAGNMSTAFTVSTAAVTTSTVATITAISNGVSKTAALTITPLVTVVLSSVSVNAASMTGGASSTGAITLSSAAPAGGILVSLSSNNASATVPATVAVAAGNIGATFSVTTLAVTSSTAAAITASYNGVNKTAPLTITPAVTAALASVSVSPVSVTGGASSVGTVTLSIAAPASGISVSLSSNNASAAVPANVTVAAGSTTATFTITTMTVSYSASASITATYNSVSKTALLSLNAGNSAASLPVTMKLLVLAMSQDDISYKSIAASMNQIGTPYQAVFVNSLTPDSSGNRLSGVPLTDSSSGVGLYQGIIQTDSSFNVCDTTCHSLLSNSDWLKLSNYAAQFSVRLVSYYTFPEARWGLLPADSGASYQQTNPLNVTLTAAGATIFSYLNSANAIPVGGQGSSGIWAYRATPTAAANESTTPLLMAGANTVGVTHTAADGRETLALTMDNYPGLLHSTAFSYGVINWVTKGVFLGSRRVYLNPQIDDLLFGNRLYAPTLPQCPADPSCPTAFATGPDLHSLANWQTNLQADPQFQSFHATFAFNGVGTTWFAPSDPVFAAMASLNSQFSWVSHTWGHANLDCYTTDGNGNCVPATLAQSQAELNQNIAVAGSLGITLDRTSVVTPFNGGLTNPNFLQAAMQAGLTYIVAAVEPPSANTGITNPLFPAIYEIPRRSPNLFDDVSSPQTGAYGSWPDEYNAKFGPNGTQALYSQNQTYSQILDNESGKLLQANMLTYEPYPLGFYIANSSTYDGTHSMFSDLMDATITKYKNLFTLPVMTIDTKDVGPLLMNRASYAASGVVGVYTPGVSVVLTTAHAAIIPVTGACSQASCATYGGQFQDNVSMTANSTVTFSLTAQ
ncbi:MAG TPA: hypothetical protein VK604_18105 [Bryobacteraceae bacterium]|nr:hypothetical protein [Bryobacteraceae bacterium]